MAKIVLYKATRVYYKKTVELPDKMVAAVRGWSDSRTEEAAFHAFLDQQERTPVSTWEPDGGVEDWNAEVIENWDLLEDLED